MSTTAMVSPQHASTKPCTSASCCSPSRLWKNIQLLINGDQREEFRKFTQDQDKLPHIVRVLLTSRLSNNPLVYNKPSIHIDRRLIDKFGKLSATDLNALEIALLQKHDHIACTLVLVLKRNATPVEVKQFLNHQWGKEKLTALHLAAFWGMSRLVRLMLDLGADPTIQNNRQLRPIDCTTHSDTITILQQQQQQKQQQTITTTTTTTIPITTPASVIVRQPSLLLKKAEKSMIRSTSPLSSTTDQYFTTQQVVVVDTNNNNNNNDYSRTPIMSPLSFSSSSSSSSSFSSLSSFDYHWTPPSSPVPYSSLQDNESPVEPQQQQQQKALSPLAMIVQQQLQKAAAVKEEDEDYSPVMIQQERPGCFPRHSSSHTIMMNDNKQQVVVLQKQKKVHFNPQIILMDACIRGDKDEIMDIMENSCGIDYNDIRDVQNRSLLHVALMHGQENLVEYLHDKININLADNDGWTCLHYAAALGLWRSLQFLTSLAHCNVNARTNHGLKVEDCPESDFGRRKCKIIMDKTLKRNNTSRITINKPFSPQPLQQHK